MQAKLICWQVERVREFYESTRNPLSPGKDCIVFIVELAVIYSILLLLYYSRTVLFDTPRGRAVPGTRCEVYQWIQGTTSDCKIERRRET